MEQQPQRWKRSEPISRQDYGIFAVQQVSAVSPRTNKSGTYVELVAPDWVNVIACTVDRKMILVRQYRHGVADVTLEIPSGIIEPGEEALEAAQRELTEETGYTAATWQSLGTVHPNPAYQMNRCYSFLASDCIQSAQQDLDPGEDIAIELSSLPEVAELIRGGFIDHALCIAAFFRYVQIGQPLGALFQGS